jgi:hypothetical protein
MSVIIHIKNADGPGEHELLIEDVNGPIWRDELEKGRRERPNQVVCFGGRVDGGHPQMWAFTLNQITSIEVPS